MPATYSIISLGSQDGHGQYMRPWPCSVVARLHLESRAGGGGCEMLSLVDQQGRQQMRLWNLGSWVAVQR